MLFIFIVSILIYAMLGYLLFKDIKRNVVNISRDFSKKNKIQFVITCIETGIYFVILAMFLITFKIDIRYFIYYTIISFAIVTPFVYIFVKMTKDILKLIKLKGKLIYKVLFILFCTVFLLFYIQVVLAIIQYI